MKTVLYSLLRVIIIVSFISCNDDEMPIINPPDLEPPKSECVIDEMIISNETNFYVFEPGTLEYGSATAIKLNKNWIASGRGFYYQSDSLTMAFSTYYFGSNNWQALTEKLEFNKVPEIKNCYTAVKENSTRDVPFPIECSYTSYEDDVIVDKYYVDENAENNYLEIDSVDLINNVIKGKFSITFLKDTTHNTPDNQNDWNPHIVRFFNGEFDVNIPD